MTTDERQKMAEIEVQNLGLMRASLVAAWIKTDGDGTTQQRYADALAAKIGNVDARIGDLIRNGVTAIGSF